MGRRRFRLHYSRAGYMHITGEGCVGPWVGGSLRVGGRGDRCRCRERGRGRDGGGGGGGAGVGGRGWGGGGGGEGGGGGHRVCRVMPALQNTYHTRPGAYKGIT